MTGPLDGILEGIIENYLFNWNKIRANKRIIKKKKWFNSCFTVINAKMGINYASLINSLSRLNLSPKKIWSFEENQIYIKSTKYEIYAPNPILEFAEKFSYD